MQILDTNIPSTCYEFMRWRTSSLRACQSTSACAKFDNFQLEKEFSRYYENMCEIHSLSSSKLIKMDYNNQVFRAMAKYRIVIN